VRAAGQQPQRSGPAGPARGSSAGSARRIDSDSRGTWSNGDTTVEVQPLGPARRTVRDPRTPFPPQPSPRRTGDGGTALRGEPSRRPGTRSAPNPGRPADRQRHSGGVRGWSETLPRMGQAMLVDDRPQWSGAAGQRLQHSGPAGPARGPLRRRSPAVRQRRQSGCLVEQTLPILGQAMLVDDRPQWSGAAEAEELERRGRLDSGPSAVARRAQPGGSGAGSARRTDSDDSRSTWSNGDTPNLGACNARRRPPAAERSGGGKGTVRAAGQRPQRSGPAGPARGSGAGSARRIDSDDSRGTWSNGDTPDTRARVPARVCPGGAHIVNDDALKSRRAIRGRRHAAGSAAGPRARAAGPVLARVHGEAGQQQGREDHQ
jgi:hypothetical protein